MLVVILWREYRALVRRDFIAAACATIDARMDHSLSGFVFCREGREAGSCNDNVVFRFNDCHNLYGLELASCHSHHCRVLT